MKKAKTTIKDLEIKIALIEQGFPDIKRRLDIIESNIEKLTGIINRGVGAWKGLLCFASFVATIAAVLKHF
jgi:hypothetical protein